MVRFRQSRPWADLGGAFEVIGYVCAATGIPRKWMWVAKSIHLLYQFNNNTWLHGFGHAFYFFKFYTCFRSCLWMSMCWVKSFLILKHQRDADFVCRCDCVPLAYFGSRTQVVPKRWLFCFALSRRRSCPDCVVPPAVLQVNASTPHASNGWIWDWMRFCDMS